MYYDKWTIKQSGTSTKSFVFHSKDFHHTLWFQYFVGEECWFKYIYEKSFLKVPAAWFISNLGKIYNFHVIKRTNKKYHGMLENVEPLWLGDLCSLHCSGMSLARQILHISQIHITHLEEVIRTAPGRVAVKMKPI